ncbi:MAG: rhodanese-like domain-containing protein [Pseudomonadota bacterium]
MNSLSDPLPTESGFRRDLVRWRQLVAPTWLAALLAGQAVEAAPAGRWRLLEVGCGDAPLHAQGHIGQAAYLDSGELETLPLWNKVDDAALLALLLRHGIEHDTTVLLYGRGALAQARAAHLMLYAGVRDVRLLDGGLAAWCAAGLALSRQCAPLVPALRFGAPFPGRPGFMADMAQARQVLGHPDGALVSVRSWSEYSGATSGYSYIAARGDIPGARWGRAGRDGDVDSMDDYHDAAGRMRPAAEIRRMWHASGIHAGQDTLFYCGTGWRASLAFFCAWLMGWPRIGVYDGGWYEWSCAGAQQAAAA